MGVRGIRRTRYEREVFTRSEMARYTPLIGYGAKGIGNGLTVLPNEGSHKADDKADHSCY